MLRYVDKLTRSPGEMERGDYEALRAVGFEDAEVLAICEVASYYAYVNRIADGLGVELEPWSSP
jgi:alkylhydroperoxidase family enzyme